MRKTRRIALAATAAVSLMLPACTGGGAGDTTDDSSGDGSAELTYLIGQPEDPQDHALIEGSLEDFEKQNPGIHIELETISNDNLRTVLQTQLRSGSGPDVFGYDTGPGFAGVLAEAGLLYDLTDAYEKYDWQIYDWAKERVTFGGKVVGVPAQVEEIGVFYNKDLFDKYGLAPPKSVDDLTRTAEKLKSEGVTPFAFSDKEGWEGGHILSIALSSAVGEDGMRELLSGERPWTSPEVVDAIELFFEDYRKAGYLPKSANAITYDNANSLFFSGKAAMTPTGTWMSRDIEETVKFEPGFFPFPAPDGPGIFSGGLGNGTFVSASTDEPKAALKFMNFLHTEEHGRWQIENFNSIPAFPVDTENVDAGPLFSSILQDTEEIAAGSGEFGYNIDVLTGDEFNEAMWDGLQSVLVDTKTPKQVASELEAAFEPTGTGN